MQVELSRKELESIIERLEMHSEMTEEHLVDMDISKKSEDLKIEVDDCKELFIRLHHSWHLANLKECIEDYIGQWEGTNDMLDTDLILIKQKYLLP